MPMQMCNSVCDFLAAVTIAALNYTTPVALMTLPSTDSQYVTFRFLKHGCGDS